MAVYLGNNKVASGGGNPANETISVTSNIKDTNKKAVPNASTVKAYVDESLTKAGVSIKITSGTEEPSGGNDGDVYIKYS